MSSTYRQSCDSPDASDYEEADPDSRLLWRFPRRRLSAEEIRDSLLAAAGRLNEKLGGESIIVPVDQDLINLLYKPSQWAVTKDAAEHDRRSIYLIAKRNLRLPFMETFDAPALQTSCPRRETSTHAPQALELLNGDFANEMAQSFANRLVQECGRKPERIVTTGVSAGIGPFADRAGTTTLAGVSPRSTPQRICLGGLQPEWVSLCPLIFLEME